MATGCLVTRLVIRDGRCTGAEYLRDGTAERADAAVEVIVCAGAVGSPQLLMLSGIGPAGHLRDHGIRPRVDLPGTGANLQDHPIAMACYAAAAPLPASRYNHGETYSALFSPPGPLPGAWPDLHLFPILLPVVPPGYPAGPPGGFALVAGLMAPASRGTVRLASADPAAPPLIDPAFLREPADPARLEAGLAMVREAAAGPAFAALGVTETWPGPATDPQRAAGVDQANGRQLLPPGRHLPDRRAPGGRRGHRPATARPRRRRAAGRRRVGDPGHPQRPPERHRARARRAGRRPHTRPPGGRLTRLPGCYQVGWGEGGVCVPGGGFHGGRHGGGTRVRPPTGGAMTGAGCWR